MAPRWKLKIIFFLIRTAEEGEITSRQIQKGLDRVRPGLKMSTIQIGHLAKLLVDRGVVERERIDPRFQHYRYRAVAHKF